MSPQVAIGVPLYNHAGHLREALESLLSQTYTDFGLMLVDDGSTDATPEIVAEYAARDHRIRYERNARRLGMTANWRRSFERACAVYPDAQYFAWASDHDVWHRRWLAALAGELDRHPAVALAYPLDVRLSPSGDARWEPWPFETFEVADPRERFRRAFMGMAAGSIVYGLFRIGMLRRTGLLEDVLAPDRLLLLELSLLGEFRQVPEVLWYRRYWGLATNSRQRHAFFPDGAPWHAYLPPPLVHAVRLGWWVGVERDGPPPRSPRAAVSLALDYVQLAARRFAARVHRRVVPPARRLHLQMRTKYRRARRDSSKAIKRQWNETRHRCLDRVKKVRHRAEKRRQAALRALDRRLRPCRGRVRQVARLGCRTLARGRRE